MKKVAVLGLVNKAFAANLKECYDLHRNAANVQKFWHWQWYLNFDYFVVHARSPTTVSLTRKILVHIMRKARAHDDELKVMVFIGAYD
jgi:hypothetical protein